MEEKPAVTKRFFKIMLPGFRNKLNLPQALCKKLAEGHRSVSEQAILETRLGKWRIRVCRNQEGLIWLENGWPDFVRDHGLKVGDLVVFEPTGSFNFKAIVFDIDACEKEFELLEASIVKDEPQTTDVEPAKESESISYESKNPFFNLTMRPYHASRSSYVTIPKKFWRANDIWSKRSITLRDPRGRRWRVDVKTYVEKGGKRQCRMGKGWHDFYAANKLKEGDVCTFQLECGEVIGSTKVVFDVHIFPKTTSVPMEL